MSDKPREWMLPLVKETSEILNQNDYFEDDYPETHYVSVIEKSAYDRVIEALKQITRVQPLTTHGEEIAFHVLRELGEIE